ncbi:MAG: histidyl-tRNA synthetase [Parcubacteria group bacterium Gr01-1014_48]|nr:MAG: histidyl-tRNA synthetase [Parcubacteria group bacterium Gr01-1014_48]
MHAILQKYGLASEHYSISVSYAGMLKETLEREYTLAEEEAVRVIKLLDKFVKGDEVHLMGDEFKKALEENMKNEKANVLYEVLQTKQFADTLGKHAEHAYMAELVALLQSEGIPAQTNIFLTRGFDYYTGMIFEVFDTNPSNNRSLFGGGRYNDLLSIFGVEKVSAVGFGMGDVTIRDVLETYNLIPKHLPKTKLLIIPHSSESIPACKKLAAKLRSEEICVALQLLDKKTGDNFKYAEKHGIPFALIVGENEQALGNYTIKNITTQDQTTLRQEEIPPWIKAQI